MATIHIKQDDLKSVAKALAKLARQSILVGIPGADLTRKDFNQNVSPITNAEIGYKMEFGSPFEKIPPRPTLIPAITAAFPKLQKRMKAAALACLVNDDKTLNDQLEATGIEAMLAVKNMINSNVPPPLSQYTIAKRVARGVTRTNTLVDTAQFRESITYVRRVI